jgi:hypothetical protein
VVLVIRNGIPVSEPQPARQQFVPRELLLEALGDAPPIDAERFRDDVDAALDQTAEPRA